MGNFTFSLIGSFVIWIFTGFKKKYSEILTNNQYADYIGIATVLLVVYLVYGVFDKYF